MRVFMNLPQVIRISNRPSKSSYELTLQGPDTADLFKEGEKLQQADHQTAVGERCDLRPGSFAIRA